MGKNKKILKVLSSVAMCSALLIPTGVKSFAAGNDDQTNTTNSVSNVQSATYYVNGKEYKVPDNQLEAFVKGDSIVDLPYDLSHKTIKETEKNSEPQFSVFAVKCEPGYEYDGKKSSSGFQKAKSGTRVINQTKKPITESSSISTSGTISGNLTGSGKFSVSVVEASVGFEIGGSYTWSAGSSTSITVDPGDWGWIDYGTYTETWVGDYYYLTSSCGQSGKFSLTAKGPKYKTKLAKTEKYPG